MLGLPSVQGYEITLEQVEEEEKVRDPRVCLSSAVHAPVLLSEHLACSCFAASECICTWRATLCCAPTEPSSVCAQPKAAVEFDQAINYVNKIKVRPWQKLRRPRLKTPGLMGAAAQHPNPPRAESSGDAMQNLSRCALVTCSCCASACADPFRHRRARVQGVPGDPQHVPEGPEDHRQRV